jgi:hypothetical protein
MIEMRTRANAHNLLWLLGLWSAVGPVCRPLHGADGPREAAQEQLAELQVLIGEWKGVGQPARGSTAGAWKEESEWVWEFTDDSASLVFKTPEGRYFQSGRIGWNGETETFSLTANRSDSDEQDVYVGTREEGGQLVLTAEEPADGRPARITIRTVADGDRLLILYEREVGEGGRFARMAEVGYTRKGSGFGKGTSYRECVVTGGLGTIGVSFEGNTYYVCCTGCKELFDDDPAGVLAEYRERKAEERTKAKVK